MARTKHSSGVPWCAAVPLSAPMPCTWHLSVVPLRPLDALMIHPYTPSRPACAPFGSLVVFIVVVMVSFGICWCACVPFWPPLVHHRRCACHVHRCSFGSLVVRSWALVIPLGFVWLRFWAPGPADVMSVTSATILEGSQMMPPLHTCPKMTAGQGWEGICFSKWGACYKFPFSCVLD